MAGVVVLLALLALCLNFGSGTQDDAVRGAFRDYRNIRHKKSETIVCGQLQAHIIEQLRHCFAPLCLLSQSIGRIEPGQLMLHKLLRCNGFLGSVRAERTMGDYCEKTKTKIGRAAGRA